MTRLVRVTPTWAPESWVDRRAQRRRTPWACRSPSPAAFSTADRSTATKVYSAAPKTPHASTRPTEIPSSSHSMRPLWRVAPRRRTPGPLGRWHRRARAGTVGGSKYVEREGVTAVLRFSGVAVSHAGLVRSGNEDSGFLGPTCMLVADGVGGAAAGEVASATAAYVVSAMALADPRPTRSSAAGRGPARPGADRARRTTGPGPDRDGHHAHRARHRRRAVRARPRGRLAWLRVPRRQADPGHPRPHLRAAPRRRGLAGRGGRARPPVAQRRDCAASTATSAEPGDVADLLLESGDRVLLASDGLTDLVTERADRASSSDTTTTPRPRRCSTPRSPPVAATT